MAASPPAAHELRAREEQLRRILESQAFRNTEVLKRLVEFLGRKALSGSTADLKEYTVGVEAFGKPEGYDPRTDSSVRVQAGKLRAKLDEYYRTEGVSDPVIVELPKGQFALAFRAFHESPVPPPVPVARLPWIVAGVSLAIALIAVVWALRPARAVIARFGDPNVRALWAPFLDDARPAMVSLGSPLFAKVSGSFLRDPVLNSWDRLEESAALKTLETAMNGKAVAAWPYTGIGEAAGAFDLARLFVAWHKDLNLVLATSLSWDDIGENNLIFLGPPKYNLQTRDLPISQDFTIEHGHIVNLHPKAGEPANWSETWAPGAAAPLEGHALISRLPGLHGTGCIMILASTSTEGTRAAVEYVTRPDYVAQLTRALRGGGSAIPLYFQAVLRARFKSQTPIQVEQVTVHLLAK